MLTDGEALTAGPGPAEASEGRSGLPHSTMRAEPIHLGPAGDLNLASAPQGLSGDGRQILSPDETWDATLASSPR